MLEQTTQRFQSKNTGIASALLSGESLFINKYTNCGATATDLILSDEQIGTIVEISDKELVNGILCTSGAFIAATANIDVSFKVTRNFAQAALTKQSIFMQKITSADNNQSCTVFLMAAATPIKIELNEGERRLIDNNSLFAMTEGVKLRLFENENFTKSVGGGEGRFMTVVEGLGTVWIAPKRKKVVNLIQKVTKMLIPG